MTDGPASAFVRWVRVPPGISGSCFAEDPARSFERADILWSGALDPSVLPVAAEPAGIDQAAAVDLPALCQNIIVVRGASCEHLLIGGPPAPLRIDVLRGTVLAGPVILRPQLVAPEPAARLQTLNRLMALAGTLGIARWRQRRDARLSRLAEALRAYDARACGVPLREIAAALFGEDIDWPGNNGSLKSRIRRAVALGRRLVVAGPSGVLSRTI